MNPPSERALKWFANSAPVLEVLKAHPPREDRPLWQVWLTNGLSGHQWAGNMVAACYAEEQARVIAEGLRLLRDVVHARSDDDWNHSPQAVPMKAIGNEQLERSPEVVPGGEVHCARCDDIHRLHASEPDRLLFVRHTPGAMIVALKHGATWRLFNDSFIPVSPP